MTVLGHIRAVSRAARNTMVRRILAHRIRARHPDMNCDPSTIWDYGYADIADIRIGRGVTVGAFAEILVHRRSVRSSVPGELILHDGAVISTGVNIRAAGGRIEIGENSALGQHCVVVAANHTSAPGKPFINTVWDETRTGVVLGRNVWVGANSTLLPGCRIGDNTLIAAGSVVRGEVPADELWGGVPARRIKRSSE
jgi:acetyltransferase-like isoleucine patch superfamily enzyme